MYYLQSRYYNSEFGRFINADDANMLMLAQGQLFGANLFAYCLNNPVMDSDPTGHLAQVLVGAAFAAVTTWLLYLVEYKLGMRKWSWWTLTGLVIINAAMGAAMGGLFGGPFTKLTKLAGLAQKAGLNGVALKAVKLVFQGTKFFINMLIKPMSRKPGESWYKAVKRLFS